MEMLTHLLFKFSLISWKFIALTSATTKTVPRTPQVPDAFIAWTQVVTRGDPPTTLDVKLTFSQNEGRIGLRVEGSSSGPVRAVWDIKQAKLFHFISEKNHLLCETTSCVELRCEHQLKQFLPSLIGYDLPDLRPFPGSRMFGFENPLKLEYMGRFRKQGIDVDGWLSTFSTQDGGVTNITSFWIANDWANADVSVPVVMEVTNDNGTGIISKSIVTIGHYFPNETNNEDLQIPQGVYCRDWKSNRPSDSFPKTDNANIAFQFRTEKFLMGETKLTWTSEWFDFAAELLRIDYDKDESGDRRNYASIVVDMKKKISFDIIQQPDQTPFCFVKQVSNYVTPDQLQQLLLLGPNNSVPGSMNEFFGGDVGTFAYNGQLLNRNMAASSWERKLMDNIDVSANLTALWEWDILNQNNLNEMGPVPIRKITTVLDYDGYLNFPVLRPGAQTVHHVYDFRYFRPMEMDPWMFDVTACFYAMFHLQFEVEAANGQNQPTSDAINSFRYFNLWKKEIADVANISLLRVSQLQTEMDEGIIYLQFKLTDMHPDTPDESRRHDNVSLVEAEAKIKAAVDERHLWIVWKLTNDETIKFATKSGSLKHVEENCDSQTSSTLTPFSSSISSSSQLSSSSLSSQLSTSFSYGMSSISTTTTFTPLDGNGRQTERLYPKGIAIAVSFGFFVLGFAICSLSFYIMCGRKLRCSTRR